MTKITAVLIDKKSVLLYAVLFPLGFNSCTESGPQTLDSYNSVANTSYDQKLAETLGADDYGMKQYVMAFLTAGPVRNQDSARAAELQRGHLDNIGRLASEGKLVLAGPFLDGGDIRGIFIFDVKTVEEARELILTDPAIQAGRLEMELRPWYGSAAILKINDIHQSISKMDP